MRQLNLKKAKEFFLGDIVFTLAFLLAFLTSFINLPKLSYIDFKVIVTLFNLMILVKGFEKYKILDFIAAAVLNGCSNQRQITLFLIIITFFSAMLVTNDVALLTFVPLTIIIQQKSSYKALYPIVLITLAANLGSSLTPMGNPQNLYIYSFYDLQAGEFFKSVLPISIFSLILIMILNLFNKKEKISFEMEYITITDKKNTMIFFVLFVTAVMSVFGIIPYQAELVLVIVSVALFERELFKKVDYKLLLTFVCFFIAIGNISAVDYIKELMGRVVNSPQSTYVSSILLSQVISNVPCTVFLSVFTPYYSELLKGVNIGGLGTIIASLASVISYRIYSKQYPKDTKKYLAVFSAVNAVCLLLMGIIWFFI